MKIHRFITPYIIEGSEIVIIDPELLHQWKNVLKFSQGEELILSDTDRHEVLCVLESLSKTSAHLRVIQEYENTKEPTRDVTLYMAILKRENFELVVQKATEIGISKIVPIITERTVKSGINMARLEKIAKEAAEQCGRSTIPYISETMTFSEALSDAAYAKLKVLFDGSGNPVTYSKDIHSLALFIGPEGGFTHTEIEHARNHEISIGSLGNLTLRGETAAIVASYIATQL